MCSIPTPSTGVSLSPGSIVCYPIRQISNQEWQSGLMEQWQAELLNVNGFSSENALHSLVLFFQCI